MQNPLARARTELTVARALPTTERNRARQLATSARGIVLREARDAPLRERIDAWLAASP